MAQFSFNSVPLIKHSRSRFDLSHTVKTSANVGTLYPFEVQEVYAGDTFKVRTTCVSRLSSQFIRPVMDNLFLDVYYFYVPSRLLYDKFVNIFGENTESAWANTVEYEVPTMSGVTIPSKSVGDFLGLPVGIPLSGVNILPFRAFAKIYNEWFRDENIISPMHVQSGERASSESPNSSSWSPNNYFGRPPAVSRLHDYFSSALPAPQKGDSVDITPVSFSDVPVEARAVNVPNNSDLTVPIRYKGDKGFIALSPSDMTGGYYNSLVAQGNAINGTTEYGLEPGLFIGSPVPVNLWANTSQFSANPISVNDLRFAFQYQRMLERDAVSGSRYVEYIQSHFGVSAGDYRLQRSEFLGGRRSPISITQVTQTTGSGSDSSPLAEVGAYSLTGSKSRFTKGFVEHGYVIGVFCIRQFHSYQQGIEKFWKRKARTDFFDPVFSHIGEQPIMATELFGSAPPDRVFGYTEAWADLRSRPARISGQMRSGVTDSLDVWHFGDNYSTVPVLSASWLQERPAFVDRTITIPSSSQDQFILDFYIQNIAYRPLPTYSVPGLIDHD